MYWHLGVIKKTRRIAVELYIAIVTKALRIFIFFSYHLKYTNYRGNYAKMRLITRS